jgi:hypothetical protein
MWHWQRTKHADAVPSWKRLMTWCEHRDHISWRNTQFFPMPVHYYERKKNYQVLRHCLDHFILEKLEST